VKITVKEFTAFVMLAVDWTWKYAIGTYSFKCMLKKEFLC
jgi:hypothetical protein